MTVKKFGHHRIDYPLKYPARNHASRHVAGQSQEAGGDIRAKDPNGVQLPYYFPDEQANTSALTLFAKYTKLAGTYLKGTEALYPCDASDREEITRASGTRVTVSAAPGKGSGYYAANAVQHYPMNTVPAVDLLGGSDLVEVGTLTTQTGLIKGSTRFDNLANYYTVPASSRTWMIGESKIAVSLWFRPDGTVNTGTLCSWVHSFSTSFIRLRVQASNILFQTQDNVGTVHGTSTPGPDIDRAATNIWTHLMFVQDRVAGYKKIYVNGKLVLEDSHTPALSVFTGDPTNSMIGRFTLGGSEDPADGDIEDIITFTGEVPTDEEVREIYRAGRNGQSAPVQAALFDTAGGKITHTNPVLSGDTDFTIEAWIYPESDGENNTGRIVDTTGGSNGLSLLTRDEGGGNVAIEALMSFSTTDAQGTTGAVFPINTWSHLIAEYDATAKSFTIIRNNSEEVLGTDTAGVGTQGDDSGNDLVIGNRSAGDRTYDGRLQNVQVWKRKLTNDEKTGQYQKYVAGERQRTEPIPVLDINAAVGDFSGDDFPDAVEGGFGNLTWSGTAAQNFPTVGRRGESIISLDGVDQVITGLTDTPSAEGASGELGILSDVVVPAAPSVFTYFWSWRKTPAAGNGSVYLGCGPNGNLQFAFNGNPSSTRTFVTADDVVPYGEEVRVGVSYDKATDTCEMWINGISYPVTPGGSAPNPLPSVSDRAFSIGDLSGDGSAVEPVSVAHVTWYPTAISQVTVDSDYELFLAGKEPDLSTAIHYWPLTFERKGIVPKDLSSTGQTVSIGTGASNFGVGVLRETALGRALQFRVTSVATPDDSGLVVVDDSPDLASHIGPSGQFSAVFFANMTGGNVAYITGIYNNDTNDKEIQVLIYNDGKVALSVFKHPDFYVAQTTDTTLLDGDLHAIALSYDARNIDSPAQLRIAIDGELKTTEVRSSSGTVGFIEETNEPMRLGGSVSTNTVTGGQTQGRTQIYPFIFTDEELIEASRNLSKGFLTDSSEVIDLQLEYQNANPLKNTTKSDIGTFGSAVQDGVTQAYITECDELSSNEIANEATEGGVLSPLGKIDFEKFADFGEGIQCSGGTVVAASNNADTGDLCRTYKFKTIASSSVIASTGDGNTDNAYIDISQSAGVVTCVVSEGGGISYTLTGGSGLNDGREHQVTINLDGTTASLYIDDSSTAVDTATIVAYPGDDFPLILGARHQDLEADEGIFRFDGNVTDELGNLSFNAYGAPTYQGSLLGQEIVFNGTSQYLRDAAQTFNPDGASGLSISGWATLNNLAVTNFIFHARLSDEASTKILLAYSDTFGKLRASMRSQTGDANTGFNSAIAPPEGQRFYFALIADLAADEVAIWLNDVKAAVSSYGFGSGVFANGVGSIFPTNIGQRTDGIQRLGGSLDNFKIAYRAKSDIEILGEYYAGLAGHEDGYLGNSDITVGYPVHFDQSQANADIANYHGNYLDVRNASTPSKSSYKAYVRKRIDPEPDLSFDREETV